MKLKKIAWPWMFLVAWFAQGFTLILIDASARYDPDGFRLAFPIMVRGAGVMILASAEALGLLLAIQTWRRFRRRKGVST